ncbi:MAG: hypothetical protein AAFX93_01220 [Verrucomicrobiota bacterium]
MKKAPLLSLVVALAFGVLLGWIAKPTPSTENVEPSAPIVSPEQSAQAPISSNTETLVSGTTDIDRLFEDLGSNDLAALAREASQSSNALESEALLRVLISEWSKTDPLAALQFSMGLGRNDLMQVALKEMGAERSSEAFDWLENNIVDPSLKGYLIMSVYQGMAQSSPIAAMELAETLPPGIDRDSVMHVVIDEWAKQDVAQVFDWLESADLGSGLQEFYRGAMNRYIQETPQLASDLIADMTACPMKTEFASLAARALANTSPDKALEWASSLDHEAGQGALASILVAWSDGSSPQRTLDFLATREESDRVGRDTASAVFTSLANNHPDLLMGQVNDLSYNEQLLATEKLAVVIGVTDPGKLDVWMSTLSAGEMRDVAIQYSLPNYIGRDAKQAFELSESIQNLDLRVRMIERVMQDWSSWDYPSAQQALMSSSFVTDRDKTALLSRVSQDLQVNDILLP